MSKSPPPGDRIAKVIARAGRASRREAERLIEEGRVSVNGAIIDRAALNVTPKDRIEIDGVPLDAPEPPRLWLYHKPTGLVTTTRDEQGRPTIYDDLPDDLPRVMTVGRLDLNSEGLLLLTNDGGVKRRLELPSTGWLRRYRVRLKGRPKDSDFDALREGITIDGENFQPMIVSLDRQQGANAWATVALREGKNREIRRAMEALGLTVNRLIRLSYGPFQLGNLKPGEVQEVRGRVLRDQLGLDGEPPEGTAKRRSGVTRRRAQTGGKAQGADKNQSKHSERAPHQRPGKDAGTFSGKSSARSSDKSSGGKSAGAFAGRPSGKPSSKPSDRSSDRFAGKPSGQISEKPSGKPSVKHTGKPSGKSTGSRSGSAAPSTAQPRDGALSKGQRAHRKAAPSGTGGAGPRHDRADTGASGKRGKPRPPRG